MHPASSGSDASSYEYAGCTQNIPIAVQWWESLSLVLVDKCEYAVTQSSAPTLHVQWMPPQISASFFTPSAHLGFNGWVYPCALRKPIRSAMDIFCKQAPWEKKTILLWLSRLGCSGNIESCWYFYINTGVQLTFPVHFITISSWETTKSVFYIYTSPILWDRLFSQIIWWYYQYTRMCITCCQNIDLPSNVVERLYKTYGEVHSAFSPIK